MKVPMWLKVIGMFIGLLIVCCIIETLIRMALVDAIYSINLTAGAVFLTIMVSFRSFIPFWVPFRYVMNQKKREKEKEKQAELAEMRAEMELEEESDEDEGEQ